MQCREIITVCSENRARQELHDVGNVWSFFLLVSVVPAINTMLKINLFKCLQQFRCILKLLL